MSFGSRMAILQFLGLKNSKQPCFRERFEYCFKYFKYVCAARPSPSVFLTIYYITGLNPLMYDSTMVY